MPDVTKALTQVPTFALLFFPKTAFPNTLAIHWFQHRLLFFRHFFERFALAHLPRSYLIHLFGSSPDAQYQHLTTSAPQEGLQATPVKSLARGLPSSLIQPIDRNLSSRHTAGKRNEHGLRTAKCRLNYSLQGSHYPEHLKNVA